MRTCNVYVRGMRAAQQSRENFLAPTSPMVRVSRQPGCGWPRSRGLRRPKSGTKEEVAAAQRRAVLRPPALQTEITQPQMMARLTARYVSDEAAARSTAGRPPTTGPPKPSMETFSGLRWRRRISQQEPKRRGSGAASPARTRRQRRMRCGAAPPSPCSSFPLPHDGRGNRRQNSAAVQTPACNHPH